MNDCCSIRTELQNLLYLISSICFFFNIEVFNDSEVTCIIFASYEEHEISKKHHRNEIKRRHGVHSLNLKIPDNRQFQVTCMRSYPEEFMKYCRMSITSFDEPITRNI